MIKQINNPMLWLLQYKMMLKPVIICKTNKYIIWFRVEAIIWWTVEHYWWLDMEHLPQCTPSTYTIFSNPFHNPNWSTDNVKNRIRCFQSDLSGATSLSWTRHKSKSDQPSPFPPAHYTDSLQWAHIQTLHWHGKDETVPTVRSY